MRVVIDTNCILQILGAQSPYNYLFDKFLEEKFQLCVSTDILLEYEEILKQKASPAAADLFMKVISRSPNVIHKDPYYRLEIIQSDADDNKFSDCAFASQADIIVTNDTHFKDAKESPFPLFNILTLPDFAALFPKTAN